MHNIYALWSHPRSMSTAIERVMRERGDLDCAHEPFMYDYYIDRKVREMPHFETEPDHPVRYEEIRDMLLERAETRPVFIKDMSYYVCPRILDDPAIAPRLVNSFLIRDPLASIASYFKLDPDVSSEEIGLGLQLDHFLALQKASGKTPSVIDADRVRADTKDILGAWWKAIGLPYTEEAFDWQNEVPEDWEQVQAWHGTATQSSGIQAVSQTELENRKTKFDALTKQAPHLRDYLEYHGACYEALKRHAI